MEKKTSLKLGYLLFAPLAMPQLRDWWVQVQTVETVPYSCFEQYLAEGKMESIDVGDRLISGRLKTAQPGGKRLVIAALVEPPLAERLSRFAVPYTRVHQSTWLRDVLSWTAPAAVFFAVWYFFYRKLGAGGLPQSGFVHVAARRVVQRRQAGRGAGQRCSHAAR